jgi:hypothetical protein
MAGFEVSTYGRFWVSTEGIEVEDAIHKGCVHRCIVERQAFSIPPAECHVDPIRSSGLLGASKHRSAEVNPDDPASRSDPSRQEEAIESRAAPEVEYASPDGNCRRNSEIRHSCECFDGVRRQRV